MRKYRIDVLFTDVFTVYAANEEDATAQAITDALHVTPCMFVEAKIIEAAETED